MTGYAGHLAMLAADRSGGRRPTLEAALLIRQDSLEGPLVVPSMPPFAKHGGG